MANVIPEENEQQWQHHLKLVIADCVNAVSKLRVLIQLLQKLCGTIVETWSTLLSGSRKQQLGDHTDLRDIEADCLARQLHRLQRAVYIFEHLVGCDRGRHAPLGRGCAIRDAINYHALDLVRRQL